jgi:hypothetical protein
MKKALAILMIFALVASVAFAEVSIGAWGRGIFLPVNHNGDDSITDTAPSWGGWAGDESRIGFTIAGNSDNVGFVIDGNVDGGAFSMGDNQYIWVKPVDMLTLRMGNLYDDTLRGNAAFGSFNWYRPLGNGDGEDITFSRVGMNRSREGFEVALAPMDALYVALYFYNLDKNLTENLFSNMQFAVGYTIDGIGQIKGQILTTAKMEDPTYALPANPDDYTYGWVDHDGDPSTEPVWGPEAVATSSGKVDETGAKIELAFNLTMVENLFVEIGFGMETNNDVPTKMSYNGVEAEVEDYKKIALYAKYNMAPVTIHFSSINEIAKVVDTEMKYKLIAGLDFDAGNGIGVSADVAYTGVTVSGADPVISGFAGVTKGYSNGKIGAGLQVLNDGEDTHFGIPVVMEFWF